MIALHTTVGIIYVNPAHVVSILPGEPDGTGCRVIINAPVGLHIYRMKEAPAQVAARCFTPRS